MTNPTPERLADDRCPAYGCKCDYVEYAARTPDLIGELVAALQGLADVVEHDCHCPPCIGSMAPGEHYLGLARLVLAKAKEIHRV